MINFDSLGIGQYNKKSATIWIFLYFFEDFLRSMVLKMLSDSI